VVESCYMDAAEKGIGVVLLNWTDEPIASLAVTILITAAIVQPSPSIHFGAEDQ